MWKISTIQGLSVLLRAWSVVWRVSLATIAIRGNWSEARKYQLVAIRRIELLADIAKRLSVRQIMTNLRRLRIEQVVDKVAMPKSTIYDKIRAGTFPAQYKDGSSSFWFEHELDAWLIKVHDLQLEPVTENEHDEA